MNTKLIVVGVVSVIALSGGIYGLYRYKSNKLK